MPIYDATTLRRLRAKLGISQSDLAQKLCISRVTMSRIEKSGTNNARIMLQLLDLVEAGAMQPAKRGRPAKRWHRYKAKRRYSIGRIRTTVGSYDDVRYWLWLPGHVDHCCAIEAPPTGIGDSWLLRSDERNVKYRYVRTGVDEQAYAGKVQFDPTLDKWVEITKT